MTNPYIQTKPGTAQVVTLQPSAELEQRGGFRHALRVLHYAGEALHRRPALVEGVP
jgi:hypothetical protein